MSNQGQQREVLKWMLWQIDRAKRHKRQLEERLLRINAERNAPIGGIGYDPLPRGAGVGNGAASITLKLAEVEDRIYKQRSEIEKCIVRVSEILDYLPVNSLEREVCELRYIDLKTWPEIEAEIPMAKSKCIEHHNMAIEILLGYPRIRKMCRDNEPAYLDYAVRRDNARDRRKRREAQERAVEEQAKKEAAEKARLNNPHNKTGAYKRESKNRKDKKGRR